MLWDASCQAPRDSAHCLLPLSVTSIKALSILPPPHTLFLRKMVCRDQGPSLRNEGTCPPYSPSLTNSSLLTVKVAESLNWGSSAKTKTFGAQFLSRVFHVTSTGLGGLGEPTQRLHTHTSCCDMSNWASCLPPAPTKLRHTNLLACMSAKILELTKVCCWDKKMWRDNNPICQKFRFQYWSSYPRSEIGRVPTSIFACVQTIRGFLFSIW